MQCVSMTNRFDVEKTEGGLVLMLFITYTCADWMVPGGRLLRGQCEGCTC